MSCKKSAAMRAAWLCIICALMQGFGGYAPAHGEAQAVYYVDPADGSDSNSGQNFNV